MPIPWSRCGNYELHDRHYDTHDRECFGWTQADQVARDLVTKVNEYLADRYGPFYRNVPAGLRLEMHPLARRYLMVSRDLWEPGFPHPSDIAEWFRVPVKVDMDLPSGSWRLVIVTEDVLLDSRMPAPAEQN